MKILPSFNFWILPNQEVFASPFFTLGKEIDGIINLAAVNAVDALSYWKSPVNPNFMSFEIFSTLIIFEFNSFALYINVLSALSLLCLAIITGMFFLKIPAFSFAIFSIFFPRNSS